MNGVNFLIFKNEAPVCICLSLTHLLTFSLTQAYNIFFNLPKINCVESISEEKFWVEILEKVKFWGLFQD